MVLAGLVAAELGSLGVGAEPGGDQVVGQPVGALGHLAIGEATIAPHDALAVGDGGDGVVDVGEVELHSHPIHARRVAMSLTFGVFIPQGWKMELASIDDPQAKWAKAVEVAVLAEELGFDSLWVYDHFHNVPVPAHETMFECWTTMAAISQRTSRIRLGQMVGCAPYRNPALLAKITSNIDVISGGRLIWGIGAGWYEHEFKGYGYPVPRRPRTASACCARRWRS